MAVLRELGITKDDVWKMRSSLCVPNNWFRSSMFGADGWCHPDGFIGTNNYCKWKNPDIVSFLLDLVCIGSWVKDLDLVLAISTGNEFIDKTRPICDQIQTGLRIKDGQVEILTAAKTRILLKQYDKKYADGTLFTDADFNDMSKKTSIFYYSPEKQSNASITDIHNKELLVEFSKWWKEEQKHKQKHD